MRKTKRIIPIELVQEQYQLLKDKFLSSVDLEERKILVRRLMNLQVVKQYLMSVDNNC